MQFFQAAPDLDHPYEDDLILKSYLKRMFPPAIHKEVEKDLKRFGNRILGMNCFRTFYEERFS